MFAADLIFVLFAQIKDQTFSNALEKDCYYETRQLKFEIQEGFAFFSLFFFLFLLGEFVSEFEFRVVRCDCLTCSSQTDTCLSASQWIYCHGRVTNDNAPARQAVSFMGNDLPCTWENINTLHHEMRKGFCTALFFLFPFFFSLTMFFFF